MGRLRPSSRFGISDGWTDMVKEMITSGGVEQVMVIKAEG